MSDFGVDWNGKMCFLDFGEVGILPLSFVAYTLSEWRNICLRGCRALGVTALSQHLYDGHDLWTLMDVG
jgi:hypothetical protein